LPGVNVPEFAQLPLLLTVIVPVDDCKVPELATVIVPGIFKVAVLRLMTAGAGMLNSAARIPVSRRVDCIKIVMPITPRGIMMPFFNFDIYFSPIA
jgi:hypothetical protein